MNARLNARLFRVLLLWLALLISMESFGQTCRDVFALDQTSALQGLEAIFVGRSIEVTALYINYSDPLMPIEVEQLAAINKKAQLVQTRLAAVVETTPVRPLDTILYPASGFDITTPFLVFPEARRIVGIDNHPFYKQAEPFLMPSNSKGDDVFLFTRTGLTAYEESMGYNLWKTVDYIRYLAPTMLIRLRNTWPSLRILRVYELIDTTRNKETGDPQRLSHGIIEFDTGDGTPVRKYIHLQNPVIEVQIPNTVYRNIPASLPEGWWIPGVENMGFSGILIKGAMSFFENHPLNKALSLAPYIREHGGVIVDGDKSNLSAADNQFGYGYLNIEVY